MMVAIAFFLLLIIFSFFAVATVVLLYHFQNYRLHKEHHRLMAGIFVIGSTLFVCAELYLFFAVPWESLAEYLPTRNQERTL